MTRDSYMSIHDLEHVLRRGSFSINNLLKHHAYQNKPLSFDDAYLLGVFTIAGYRPELQSLFPQPPILLQTQSVAALCSLHNRALYEQPGAAAQIAGICAAVFDYDIGHSTNGFVEPGVAVMDNCGMGGDLYRTPNLSTIAALIAAADGLLLLKHGSPGNTDNVGSSDFLRHCGVNLFADKAIVERAINDLGFAYTEALDESYKKIHTQTHSFAKLAHMNDIIGPITNPVNPDYMNTRVVGVNHLIPPEQVAQAYVLLNEAGVTAVRRGLFVRGFRDQKRNGGIDEVSIMPGGTIVAELYDQDIHVYDVFAKDFGLEEMSAEELDPGAHKEDISRRILSGALQDKRMDAALANASILFYLNSGMPFSAGTQRARSVLASGKPYAVLQQYAARTRGESS